MPVKVDVTQADVNDGRRSDCRDCPIARAIQRATGNPNISIGLHHGRFWKSADDYTVFQIPEVCAKFIVDFDGGLPVSPFSFEVTL